MKVETLNERLDKAIVRSQKKENTITKKTTQIEKKYKELEKIGIVNPAEFNADCFRDHSKYEDISWLYYEIDNLKESINNNRKEIEEIQNTITKYKAQLSGEIEREQQFSQESPDIFKELKTELVNSWDEWDKNRRDFLYQKYTEIGYKKFIRLYSKSEYDLMHKSDIEIHTANESDARFLVLDLYNRVKNITGEVTDWSNIYATSGTQGISVLNGFVKGEEGTAKVESILAGGYNIQKLHIRVLVKSL